MDHFTYRHGVLHGESIALHEVAQRFGTPTYVYSKQTLLDHYNRLNQAFAPLNPTICFSIKSCSNLSICRLLGQRGSAFDVVSGGELRRALEAGADPARVVFAGVGKADSEIRAALDAGIGWFNVESEEELDNVANIATAFGESAPLARGGSAGLAPAHSPNISRVPVARVALRVNPDVDPKTHVYTTTGKRETKFGVDLERARRVFAEFRHRRGIEMAGVHLHIGSPVNNVSAYVESIERGLMLIEQLRSDGHSIRALNIGGGFGAHYDGGEAPSASAYAEQIVPLLSGQGLEVLLEPGRSIAANGGVLLARVLYTKASGDRKFVIVDAAMTELIRPALYGSFHFAWPVCVPPTLEPPLRSAELRLPGTELVDVVGPVCESGDFLAKSRWLPPMARGDLLCIFSTGAYGFCMSSQYNSRPRAPEVLIEGTQSRLIRRRETYDDLVEAERFERP